MFKVERVGPQSHPAEFQQHCYFMACVDACDAQQQLIIIQSLQWTPVVHCIASQVKTADAIVAATVGSSLFH